MNKPRNISQLCTLKVRCIAERRTGSSVIQNQAKNHRWGEPLGPQPNGVLTSLKVVNWSPKISREPRSALIQSCEKDTRLQWAVDAITVTLLSLAGNRVTRDNSQWLSVRIMYGSKTALSLSGVYFFTHLSHSIYFSQLYSSLIWRLPSATIWENNYWLKTNIFGMSGH